MNKSKKLTDSKLSGLKISTKTGKQICQKTRSTLCHLSQPLKRSVHPFNWPSHQWYFICWWTFSNQINQPTYFVCYWKGCLFLSQNCFEMLNSIDLVVQGQRRSCQCRHQLWCHFWNIPYLPRWAIFWNVLHKNLLLVQVQKWLLMRDMSRNSLFRFNMSIYQVLSSRQPVPTSSAFVAQFFSNGFAFFWIISFVLALNIS